MPVPTELPGPLGGRTPLQVSTLEAVALSAEQLQVADCGGTTQGHRDDVIVLTIKFAAAFGALAAVSFEDCAADLTGDGLPLPLRPWLVAFVDVEHHVRPVHALSGSALAVPD